GTLSSSSEWIHFGSSGASTWVSIPSAGRWVANLSGRWTPPPPAGGKYIVTRRIFTAVDRTEGCAPRPALVALPRTARARLRLAGEAVRGAASRARVLRRLTP